MRICVLGNSHVAALKQAWTRLKPDMPQHDMRFFAAMEDRMSRLTVDDGTLTAGLDYPELARFLKITSGGDGVIRPDEFDVFFVYGLLFNVPCLDARLSSRVLECCCADSFGTSLACTVARKVRSISEAPVVVTPNPLKARPRPADKAPHVFLPYQDVIERLEAHCEKLGYHFMPQPRSTIDDRFTTKRAFNKDARLFRSELKWRAGDVSHMNEEFGKLVIAGLLERAEKILQRG